MQMPEIILLLSTVSERVTEKSAHMADVDPHGFTLSIISVALVFFVLVLLFIAYNISGSILSRKKENISSSAHDKMDEGPSEEEAAAISLALTLYLGQNEVHDAEPGIITIRRK